MENRKRKRRQAVLRATFRRALETAPIMDGPTKPAAAKPADGAPVLVLFGLVARDGSGELAFCNGAGARGEEAILLDLSAASAPDEDGDVVAFCPRCRTPHWAIGLENFLIDYDSDSFFDEMITIRPEVFLADTIRGLRAKAVRS